MSSRTSRIRVRGIYTTAVTRRLQQAEFDVVQASPPIRRRFDADFEIAEYDAAVDATDDRQGVGVSGEPDAVDSVVELLADTGRDAFGWAERAPRGAMFDAVVSETLGSGAVVDLGHREGFLPYGSVDRRVDAGDRVRVQVHDPAPPWGSDRPVVGTDVTVFGGVASLSRGVDRVVASACDGATRRELARTTEMLPTDAPDEWGVRWERAAADAGVDAMNGSLRRAVERARTVDEALAETSPGDDAPRRLIAPERTEWVWFGRESRFGLDGSRREVASTMVGHHRVKAARESASAAVDFAEAVCDALDEFPTGAVLRQFGPAEGDRVAIEHGKPDGRLFTLGRGEVTACDPDEGKLTLRREMTGGGSYDGLDTERESGDVAVTRLKEGRWWYPTTYRSEDGEAKGTYVNVCTPVELFPDAARYVDLHVDVVRHADGAVERVDDDELDDAVDAGHVSEALAERTREVASGVTRALE